MDKTKNRVKAGPKSVSLLSDYFKPPEGTKLTAKEKQAFNTFGKGVQDIKQAGFSRLATNLSRFDPEIRNPLLQSENFYLPQQTTRTGAPNVELNRWFSYYFKYHPLVGNLISLHSQLPLSRFGFQGIKDSSILQAYEDCADDMDMFSAMVDFLKTWFLYGETQPYLFWNDDLNRFDGVAFLDTSFIDVFGHTFFHNHNGDPTRLYSMIPDDLLVELLATNHPRVQELVNNNLPDSLITAVRENKPLLLNNFNTELVVRSASPWDVRGTSVVLGCLKELMYEDKLREAQYCYKPDTEVITDRGFVKINEVTLQDKVATYNEHTRLVEYQSPDECLEFDFAGDLIRFQTRKVDFTATPNHRMFVENQAQTKWSIKRADNVNKTDRVMLAAKHAQPADVSFIEVLDKKIDTALFVEFLGYFISEGWITNYRRQEYSRGYRVTIPQKPFTESRDTMENCLKQLPWSFKIKEDSYPMYVSNKEFALYMEQFGINSLEKHIPTWVKDLPGKYLEILLQALCLGDGHVNEKQEHSYFSYASASEQLIDDIQEIAWKCGYSVLKGNTWVAENPNKATLMYTAYWSDFSGNKVTSLNGQGKKLARSLEKYEGKVYCLRVPNGLFAVRQNGKITIQGNSIAEGHVSPKWIWKLGQAGEYMPSTDDVVAFRDTLISANNDPMFNLITHYAVNLQVEGSSGRILPIVPEIKFVEERIMSALFSNKALVTGSGVTYANSSVALRALMSRYIPIRTMAENFFMRKVFLPIALANKYYERKEADLTHNVRTSVDKLIIPKFNWSHKQNLLDDSNIKNMLIQLRTASDLPMKTICDSLDLDYSEVKSYLKQEQGTVFDKTMQQARQAAVTAATNTQTANIAMEKGKSVWLELLKKIQFWKLPQDQAEYNDAVESVEDTPDNVASVEQSNPSGESDTPAPPTPGAPGGVPDSTDVPEENADIPEPANAGAPLGASLDKEQRGNLINGFKEALQYFDIPSTDAQVKQGGKLKLKRGIDQFDFLRQASHNVLNDIFLDNAKEDEGAKETVLLTCANDACNWNQSYFLLPSVVDHVRTGNYSALKISADRTKLLEKVVGNMKWPTLDAYTADKDKLCPKCKKSNVKKSTVSGDEKNDTQQTTSESDKS